MSPSILIQNGRLIDPAHDVDRTGSVLLADGRVAAIDPTGATADVVIDAGELIVTPGLIDMHVHLREPGREQDETIASGTAAAVAAGFTTVAAMPNTDPPIDNEAGVAFVKRQAGKADQAFVAVIGCVTVGQEGERLAEMGNMQRSGAVAFSDDGRPIASAAMCRRALLYAKMLDVPIIEHAEEPTLSAGGQMHAGVVSAALGLPGIPAIAEQLIVQRDAILAASTGGRVHVAHCSAAASVEAIRAAKRAGVRITAEVTPHHLALTDEAVRRFDPNYKMNPPLRAADDVAALKEGLSDGTIDCLASDHAPHGLEAKEVEFSVAAFGIIGLETALPIYIEQLIAHKVLTWRQMVEKMTVNPARILGLSGRGHLGVGAVADVTLIDPDLPWRIDVAEFVSKSRNCPWNDHPARGKAVATIVRGKLKHTDPSAAERVSGT
jgi:dihydroorotase